MPFLSPKAMYRRHNKEREVYQGRPPGPRIWTHQEDRTIRLCMQKRLNAYETWEVMIAADLYCTAASVEERIDFLREHPKVSTTDLGSVPSEALTAIEYIQGG